MNIKIKNENITAVFSPLAGASLRSLSVRNNKEEYDIISNFEDEFSPNKLPLGSGSFIMAPWVNWIKSGILETDKGFTSGERGEFGRSFSIICAGHQTRKSRVQLDNIRAGYKYGLYNE